MPTAPKPDSPDALVSATSDLLLCARFIDLRAPVEFARGALPGAVNLPLMTDAERAQVGTVYAREGQEAAVILGHQLVSGALRHARLAAWSAFARAHPQACLYCARGGLRSQTVQGWLRDAGVHLPRVTGGFKAIRQLCLEVLERAPHDKAMLVVGGRTGTGKTELLQRIAGAIDLEALANHRSSAFGGMATPQPGQVGFENALAVACLRHAGSTLILEDESRSIGHVSLPETWYETMQRAPVLVLEADMAERSRRIERDYVFEPLGRGLAPAVLQASLAASLLRIRRRLGGERHAEIARLLAAGFTHGEHGPWIERLLGWYYDPIYDRQLERRREHVAWRGSIADAPRVISGFRG